MPQPNYPFLYTFRRCPYAIRARLAITYAGISVEHREILLKNKPESMLTYSSKGTVPVLVLPDDTVIDESLDIMHWAIQQNDPDSWYPKNAFLRKEIDALIAINDIEFKPLLDKYKYASRFPEHNEATYQQSAELFIAHIESLLSASRFLVGENITLADVAVFPFIRQFAFVDIQWFEQCQYEKTRRWLNQFLDSQLFAQAMKKFAQWSPDNPPLLFPSV